MPQSLAQLITHIIFSTKHRQPLITPAHAADLHAYLGGVLKRIDCVPVEIGGTPDHVHVLCFLSRTHAPAETIEVLKTSSSKWLKPRDVALGGFHWQSGYGAFSVSRSNLEAVRDYIRRQGEHHRQQTFQEEYRAFLVRHGIEFDERYVWD